MRRIILSLGLFLFACATAPQTKPNVAARPANAKSSETEAAKVAKANTSVGILVYGRSVTEDWFRFRGVPSGRGYQRGRYRLVHNSFEPYQPDIVRWPAQIVSDLQRFGKYVKAVHYKLCFVDFNEKSNIGDYRELANEIFQDVVIERKKLLIVGNALPLVAESSSAPIIAQQRAYNEMLRTLSLKHPKQVFIFDQYALLANASGHLKTEFAASKTDSHLNLRGYEALEKAYFAFLDLHFAALP